MGKLRIRARSGEARAGAPFVAAEAEGEGRFLGFTLRLGTKSPAAMAGRVELEADGAVVDRSLTLASAFDGADGFGGAPHATIGAGVSSVGGSGLMAYGLRLTRLVPFRKSFRATVDVPSEAAVPIAAASFSYVSGLNAASASAPAK